MLSSETINIAASTQKLDVDNRLALRFYYRIADNILKQVFLRYTAYDVNTNDFGSILFAFVRIYGRRTRQR